VRILHAPSDREIKGTRHLLDAVERLKAAGYPVELLMLEGVPHDRVAEFCGQADIAVDQLMIGAYGTVAIEMMAKGVPVVCRIRDDLRHHYPQDLPIVSAGPDEIYDVLEGLLQRPDNWPELGRRGIEYVRHEHEMHRVAARTLALYGAGFANLRNRQDAKTPSITM
jgi:glycosyltransferase involved in cell wall biosynthesis